MITSCKLDLKAKKQNNRKVKNKTRTVANISIRK